MKGVRGWPALLVPPLRLKRPLGPNDRLILTLQVGKAIVDVAVVERVAVRRSRKKAPVAK